MLYTFDLYNADGSQKWSIPFLSISLTEELNKGVDGTLTVPYSTIEKYAEYLNSTPDDIVAGGARNWILSRGNVPLFGGILMGRQIAMGEEGPTSYIITFAGRLALLAKRRTNAFTFRENVDSVQIAWEQIDQANDDPSGHGDTLIRLGLAPEGKPRQRTMRFDNIRDLIVGMSNEKQDDGYDVEVDINNNINFYVPKKGESKPYIIIDNFRYINGNIDRPLQGRLSNRLHVLGKGQEDEMVFASVEDDSEGGPMETWGLLEDVVNEKGVERVEELTDRGLLALSKLKYPYDTFSIAVNDDDPDVQSYSLGDSVTIVDDRLGFYVEKRVVKRTFNIDSSGKARVTLGFEQG